MMLGSWEAGWQEAAGSGIQELRIQTGSGWVGCPPAARSILIGAEKDQNYLLLWWGGRAGVNWVRKQRWQPCPAAGISYPILAGAWALLAAVRVYRLQPWKRVLS